MLLPCGLGPECLQDEWNVATHQQESRLCTFWDTFEWGVWFSGHLLYSSGSVYYLCVREDGWLGAHLCEEKADNSRRFWRDFETVPMRAKMEAMLGLRGLASVVEGRFSLQQSELRNDLGKIVCRLEWSSVSAGKQREVDLLCSCQVMPLLGYEAEAARVVKYLALLGARSSGDGPLDVLLRHASREPRKYTLRPAFDLRKDTPAREAVGRIVRTILEIAIRNIPGILNDLDTEFLHDYRICLRKIRSLLTLVKDVYPTEKTLQMRKILGDLARQTNLLRDLDVYLLDQDEYLGLLPPEFRPSLQGMFEDFSAERKVEVRRVMSKMRSPARWKLIREIEEYFSLETRHEPSSAADLPVGQLAFNCIHKHYRKIRKIAAEIGADTPDEVIHQLRIECKKLRYLTEFFSEIIPKEEGGDLKTLLRGLQNQLGKFNDASVQQKSLLAYCKKKQAGDDTALGLGGLISILYQSQQQARGQIHQALEEFCHASKADAFKRTFKLPASVPATNAQGLAQP